VITGAASAFSAGVDLQRLAGGRPEYAREHLPALSGMFLAIFDHPGPTLAAVNGHAIAGGCVMVAACDVPVMARRGDRPDRSERRCPLSRGGAGDVSTTSPLAALYPTRIAEAPRLCT
jgi:1,4-dihydroxy-2-naphthoyl-CoA synthase